MKSLLLLLAIAFSIGTLAQRQSFDIASYTMPPGWQKQSKPGIAIYTNSNQSKGAYCIIAIYASTQGSDNPEQDFADEWKDLAIGIYGAKPGPKTETQNSPDGWKGVAGAASIVQDSIGSYIVLTVFSGFGKKMSVLSNFNNQSYLSDIDKILENIKMDTSFAGTINIKEKDKPVVNPSNEATEKFGHIVLPLVKGWTLKKYSNASVFTPNDLIQSQYFELRIMEPKPFSGTMQQALDESWNDALRDLDATKAFDGKPYTIEKEKASYKGWDYIKGAGVFHANTNSIDKFDLRLFVIKLNNRIERIAVWGLMNVSHDGFSPWANPMYQHAIEDFFYSIKFDDWKEPGISNGLIKDEGIYGLYEGLKLAGGKLGGAYTLFFPNGQVFNGSKFPSQGFYGLNTWAAAELNTRYWGTYSLQSGKGMIKMGYGNIPFTVNGNDLVVTTQNTEHAYEKIPSVDGSLFNGTYTFDGKWDGSSPSVTFTEDGKFIDNGALNILNHQTMDPYNITKNPGSGTYKVKDFTIIFNYSDGRTVQIVFIGEGYNKKNKSPAALTFSFNNDILYKK